MDARENSEPLGGPTSGQVRTGGATGRPDRWAAVAGLVFTALVVASFFMPDIPSSDSPAEDIAAQLAADNTAHRLSLLLGFLADVAFLVFLAGLWSRLRRWEGPAGMFAALILAAGAAFVTLMLISGGLHLALVQYASGGQPDPAVLPALTDLNQWVGAAILPPSVAMFLGATVAILTTRALPRWLGWLAAATAVLQLISLAGVFQTTVEGVVGIAAFSGFLLFLVWVLATSVVLLLRPGQQPAGA
ncbi:small-conductance mechanosensitive channel [Agromyces albus]|nr:small-conductance mechanosensitive channel [Agromyces albus]